MQAAKNKDIIRYGDIYQSANRTPTSSGQYSILNFNVIDSCELGDVDSWLLVLQQCTVESRVDGTTCHRRELNQSFIFLFLFRKYLLCSLHRRSLISNVARFCWDPYHLLQVTVCLVTLFTELFLEFRIQNLEIHWFTILLLQLRFIYLAVHQNVYVFSLES